MTITTRNASARRVDNLVIGGGPAGAMVALEDGELAVARDRAAAARQTAVAAADMPLIASVALVAAELALALGDAARAA